MKKIFAIGIVFVAGLFVVIFPTGWRGACILSRAAWLFCLPSSAQINTFTIHLLAYTALQEKVIEQKISLFSALLVITKTRLFPTFLVLYLFSLFVQQTEFLSLHLTRLFLLLDPSLLLFCLGVFGIGVWLFPKVTLENQFTISSSGGSLYGRLYLFFVGFVANVGVWVVWQSSYDLGILTHLISSATGSLIVLGGFLFFQNEIDDSDIEK